MMMQRVLLLVLLGICAATASQAFFRSKNYPGYCWDLNDKNEAYITRGVTKWEIIPGICGIPGSVSFRRVEASAHFFPPTSNTFLRHYVFLFQHKFEDTKQFRDDACFIPRLNPFGHAPGYYSFETVNYPNYFIRHSGYRLMISLNDKSHLFKDDASFKVLGNLAVLTSV